MVMWEVGIEENNFNDLLFCEEVLFLVFVFFVVKENKWIKIYRDKNVLEENINSDNIK